MHQGTKTQHFDILYSDTITVNRLAKFLINLDENKITHAEYILLCKDIQRSWLENISAEEYENKIRFDPSVGFSNDCYTETEFLDWEWSSISNTRLDEITIESLIAAIVQLANIEFRVPFALDYYVKKRNADFRSDYYELEELNDFIEKVRIIADAIPDSVQAYIDLFLPESVSKGMRLTLNRLSAIGESGNDWQLWVGTNIDQEVRICRQLNQTLTLSYGTNQTLGEIIREINDAKEAGFTAELLPDTDPKSLLGTGRRPGDLFGPHQAFLPQAYYTSFVIDFHDGVTSETDKYERYRDKTIN